MNESLTLSNGIKMPILGLGTWQSAPGEVEAAVESAIDIGYRLIDTAFVYGNEEEIGRALQKVFAKGKVKRSDLFITTKISMTHHKEHEVQPCLERQLKKLQLEYVDLYLIHIPAALKRDGNTDNPVVNPTTRLPDADPGVTFFDTWKGFEHVYKLGLTKAIGLSNFGNEQVERLCAQCNVKPHNHQVEAHLYFPQFELQEISKRHGITLTAYAPLGSPGRFEVAKVAPIKFTFPDPGKPMEDKDVLEIAKAHNKKPSHVLMRWLIQRDWAVIPKSVNAARIKENSELFDFKLTEAEMKRLNNAKIRQRFFLQDYLEGHPDDPFKSERVH